MDVVVTVPKTFGLDRWIAEGDPAGAEWSGNEWHFYLWGTPPRIEAGERVYVVYNGMLRGYAPLVCIDQWSTGRYGLVRHGGAVAVTIHEHIRGFRGYRYRWWDTDIEVPFPDWQNPNAHPPLANEETILKAAALADDHLDAMLRVAIEQMDERAANRLMDKVHQVQKEDVRDLTGWRK